MLETPYCETVTGFIEQTLEELHKRFSDEEKEYIVNVLKASVDAGKQPKFSELSEI